MRGFIKKHRTAIILVAILAVGLGLLLYPTVSDWWNSFHQTRAIAAYKEAVEDLSADEKAEMLEAAHAYNERIAQRGINFYLSDEEKAEYESLLDLTGTGIMGYVEIPAINVNLPIYHGTEESVLQIAVGHLEGSSLPVGGENTHASVSGHRGLPSARLFTDLDQLEEGDIFTVTVLDETITYMVDQIRIVLPEETSELMIQQGEDHMTLITCTPYGVNSHRILVRGIRTDNVVDLLDISDAERIPIYLVIPAVGIPILFVLLLIMLFYYRNGAPQMSGREMLEAYRQENAGAVEKQEKTPGEQTEKPQEKTSEETAEKPKEETSVEPAAGEENENRE